MKRPNAGLPRLVASLFVVSVTGLTACASDDGTTDDTASGGTTGTGGAGTGGAGTGGVTGSGGDTATGGVPAGDGGGAAMDPNELPADNSQASIEAFLAAGTYMNAPWVGDAAPRAQVYGATHGETMRVFFNSAAAATKTRNDSTLPAEPGSMIVKELYEAGAVVGHAVSIKTGDGSGWNTWTHYCTAPAGSTICTGSADTYPIYQENEGGSCGFCHAEIPVADLPQ